MSIYAKNYVVNELTGEAKLVKHLNKIKVNRHSIIKSGKWNKTGKKARVLKGFRKHIKKTRKKINNYETST